MRWNWEQKDWPEFLYDAKALETLEQQFMRQSGEFVGVFRHVGADDQNALRIELISEEAIKTSEIEGEILNRDSVQSSLRHQFGLGPENKNIPAAERGVAAMMTDLYEHFARPLDEATLFAWHKNLLGGDKWIRTIGGYRTHDEPMQVVSGPISKPKVHFEARLQKLYPQKCCASSPGSMIPLLVEKHRCLRSRVPDWRICTSCVSIRLKMAMAGLVGRLLRNLLHKILATPV